MRGLLRRRNEHSPDPAPASIGETRRSGLRFLFRNPSLLDLGEGLEHVEERGSFRDVESHLQTSVVRPRYIRHSYLRGLLEMSVELHHAIQDDRRAYRQFHAAFI